jgi:hypothetical protein
VTFENLIGKGLQREPANAEEIQLFLARITTKLVDAKKAWHLEQGKMNANSKFSASPCWSPAMES